MPGFRQLYLRKLMLLFLILTAAAGLVPTAVRGEGKMMASPRVLILNSYHKGFEWSDEETAGVTEVLKKADLHPVVYTEYADWKRFPSDFNRENLFSTLLYKYSGTDIDLIVALDDFAVDFALEFRQSLFNNAPVVYAGVVEGATDNLLYGQTDITGVLENVDPIPTIRTAITVNPEISNVYLLHDRSESGEMTGKQIQEKISATYPELAVVPLDGKTFPEVLDLAEGMDPERDMLLMTTYFSDVSGSTVEFETAAKELGMASKAPVYHLYDFGIKYGGFGGSVISGRLQGEKAAELALRILKGEKA
ncbi:MAG: putative rane protein, partial [Paenibacillaceae bacterium]|nr:putative rane protein [Paenibacillaceae bacterium]